MHRFSIDDKVKVTDEHAPFFGESGVIRDIDMRNPDAPLIGVRLAGRRINDWYGQREITAVPDEPVTEEIRTVGA